MPLVYFKLLKTIFSCDYNSPATLPYIWRNHFDNISVIQDENNMFIIYMCINHINLLDGKILHLSSKIIYCNENEQKRYIL